MEKQLSPPRHFPPKTTVTDDGFGPTWFDLFCGFAVIAHLVAIPLGILFRPKVLLYVIGWLFWMAFSIWLCIYFCLHVFEIKAAGEKWLGGAIHNSRQIHHHKKPVLRA